MGLSEILRSLALAGLLLATLAGGVAVRADEPVVRAVLFFSPTCPHCEQVINVDLPPLLERHGDRLQIVLVDVTQEQGAVLYEASVVRFDLQERIGVPTLIVADTALVGSGEIPGRFPSLVDELLAAGGADWPDVPGLAEAIAAANPTRSCAVRGSGPECGSLARGAVCGPGPDERRRSDRYGRPCRDPLRATRSAGP